MQFFQVNHSFIWWSSSVIVWIKIVCDLCQKNTLVSKANNYTKDKTDNALGRSLNRRKRRCPRLDPWGTPCSINLRSDRTPNYRGHIVGGSHVALQPFELSASNSVGCQLMY